MSIVLDSLKSNRKRYQGWCQADPVWQTPQFDIKKSGCTLTAAAEILNSEGITLPDGK